jgi:hypothetical protein
MKAIKFFLISLCVISFSTTALAKDDECSGHWTYGTAILANCRKLERIEANQQKILEDQKKIKQALQLLVRLRGLPNFDLESLATAGEK